MFNLFSFLARHWSVHPRHEMLFEVKVPVLRITGPPCTGSNSVIGCSSSSSVLLPPWAQLSAFFALVPLLDATLLGLAGDWPMTEA